MVVMGVSADQPGAAGTRRPHDVQRSDDDEVDTAQVHDRVAQGHEWAAQAGGGTGTHHLDTAAAHRRAACRIRDERQAGPLLPRWCRG